ncbi:biotin--[acetyl-CoA-carboxylase] ligase [Lutibacter sp.]|uniref:biotin--[acetyl-CoA-carboxylase] ligase n=1 Tax=Lutibacter sp. TaxID=1925666 RepID=UPI0035694E91
MNIIKLNAIDSTNSYLKGLAVKSFIESYTVVIAEHQTEGRGQMGTTWVSDNGKNLTFSVLINFKTFKVQDQFYLSMAVSLAVLNSVKMNVKTPIAIKWPNDILAGKDKLAGILIENVLSGNFIKQSIVGIGLNVNQQVFSNSIGRATSLKMISGINFDNDLLLAEIITSIRYFVGYIERNEFKQLKVLYLESLYQFNKPTMFEDKIGTVFLGKIVDVFEDGKLVVEFENEKTHKFNLKEIKFASL